MACIDSGNPVAAIRFIGIDLGWQTGPSGVCSLAMGAAGLTLMALERQNTHAEVLAWLDVQAPLGTPAIVAVDAPTIITNATGMRLPDRLAHQKFGKYHAGCYPANLKLPFAASLLAFSQALTSRGFLHGPELQPQQPGRYQIEFFPHPAMVHLFQLPRILKYKKGRLAERRLELARLRSLILAYLPQQTPSLQVQSSDLPEIPERGPAMKSVEDRLDSLICAYGAAYWWYWGLARNWVLGNLAEGFIVVPAP
jgi:predicted RNase H-like nuclease